MSKNQKLAIIITFFALPVRGILLFVISFFLVSFNIEYQLAVSHVLTTVVCILLILKLSPYKLIENKCSKSLFKKRKEIICAILFSLLYILVYYLFQTVFNVKSSETIFSSISLNLSIRSLLFIQLVLLTPLMEELFFRGFLIKTLENFKLNSTWIVFITSLLFMALHASYNIFDSVMIFLLGIILSVLRIRFNSLISPILIHSIINLTYFIGSILRS